MMNNNEIMALEMQNIKHNFLKQVNDYRNYLHDVSLDIPIEVLCLPKSINKILLRNGLSRVKNVAAFDLTKVKGLGDKRIDLIRFRIDEFLAM